MRRPWTNDHPTVSGQGFNGAGRAAPLASTLVPCSRARTGNAKELQLILASGHAAAGGSLPGA